MTTEEILADHERRIRALEGVSPSPPPDPVHPDDDTKHKEHLAFLKLKPIPNVTIKHLPGSRFVMTPGDKIELTARPYPRDLANDPTDLSGIVGAHCPARLRGTPKTRFAVPDHVIDVGDTSIEFTTMPDGWLVGDELAIAGNAFDQTERVTITGIDDGVVSFSPPTQFQHGGLYGHPGANHVANLTTDTWIKSTVARADRTTRGHHVMLMHDTDAEITNVGFYGLGRTDAYKVHTLPQFDEAGQIVPGTDSNTVGRYSLHSHVRAGVDYSKLPTKVTSVVVDGSPKHGIVNHGGYMFVKDCIIIDCDGSDIFTENGAGIGWIKGNLSIGTANPRRRHAVDERNPPPPLPEDHGGTGFGLWVQDGPIEATDNTVYTKSCGFAMFQRGNFDSTPLQTDEPVRRKSVVLTRNVNPPDGLGFERPPVDDAAMDPAGVGYFPAEMMPGYFARNTAIGCEVGFQGYCVCDETSYLKAFTAIACETGFRADYTRNLTATDLVLRYMDPSKGHSGGWGILGNTVTENLTLERFIIEGYDHGMQVPGVGWTRLRDGHLDCRYDINVPFPWGDELTMDRVTFGNWTPNKGTKLYLENLHRDVRLDFSDHFKPCKVLLNGKEIIHECRMPGAIPFPTADRVPDWDGWREKVVGKTNREMFAESGLWVGGMEIPDVSLVPHPDVTGGGTIAG